MSGASPSLAARGLLGLIWLYRHSLSPIMGRQCRFYPSCSAYAAEAVRRHGALRGAFLTARRLLRCQPWGGAGYDPVPGEFSAFGAKNPCACGPACDRTPPE